MGIIKREEVVESIMRADVEASEAYRHTDHSGFVAEAADSTWLAAVALESCIRRGWEVVACQ